jgi:hypothetical protein
MVGPCGLEPQTSTLTLYLQMLKTSVFNNLEDAVARKKTQKHASAVTVWS